MCFAGDSVSDRLLTAVAAQAGSQLIKIKLTNTKNVTDAALCTLIQSAPSLQSFVADELDKAAGAQPWPAAMFAFSSGAAGVGDAPQAATSTGLLDSPRRGRNPSCFTGKFLVPLFECPDLTLAHVASIPSLNWGPCKAAAAAWPPGQKAMTKLVARTVNLDEHFGNILAKLGGLTEIEMDGPARNVRVAALSW